MVFRFYNPGKIPDEKISRVAVSIRCDAKWLFGFVLPSMTWDLPESNRFKGESIDDAAKRILDSVEHLKVDEIRMICPYSYDENGETVYGVLFFVSASAVPSGEDFRLFDKLPDDLHRPVITRRLFTGTQGWLNMQTNADELWDVYDANRNLTGRLHRRGDFLPDGDYHLVVHIWLLNSKGEFLLTKRAPNKGFPNTWETSGGAAQAGDDSLTAALREVREETGLIAKAENAERIFEFRREDDFCDVWLVRQDFSLSDVVLLPGETIDKMYVHYDKLLGMRQNKELIPYSYLPDLLNLI